MPAQVLGHWEIGWDTPWQEYSWWRYPLLEFGVDHYMMIPRTGIQREGVTEYDSIQEARAEYPDYTVVFVDESAEVDLVDFQHPANALYVLGKTSYSPYVNRGDMTNWTSVRIPSILNSGGFWANQAISIILYDRYLKEQSQE